LGLTVSELENKIATQQTKINEQNRSIKILLDKTVEFEKFNEKLKSEIITLKKNKLDAEKSMQQQQKTIQDQKKSISELEETKRNNEQEIERLKNLKWHQKLFGQK